MKRGWWQWDINWTIVWRRCTLLHPGDERQFRTKVTQTKFDAQSWSRGRRRQSAPSLSPFLSDVKEWNQIKSNHLSFSLTSTCSSYSEAAGHHYLGVFCYPYDMWRYHVYQSHRNAGIAWRYSGNRSQQSFQWPRIHHEAMSGKQSVCYRWFYNQCNQRFWVGPFEKSRGRAAEEL